METSPSGGTMAAEGSLGNFLSGMETAKKPPQTSLPRTLETSLVEWKHGRRDSVGRGGGALETSLVEWKPHSGFKPPPATTSLETSLVEWKHWSPNTPSSDRRPLETSLVEWKRRWVISFSQKICRLGNFLSGMETWSPEQGLFCAVAALETSLVEWKPDPLQHLVDQCNSLGNFLSGMETPCIRRRG